MIFECLRDTVVYFQKYSYCSAFEPDFFLFPYPDSIA